MSIGKKQRYLQVSFVNVEVSNSQTMVPCVKPGPLPASWNTEVSVHLHSLYIAKEVECRIEQFKHRSCGSHN